MNLNDRTGIALFNAGKEELPSKYNGTEKQLPTLLYHLGQRAKKCCWGNILNRNVDGVMRNLLTQHTFYGQIHIDDTKRQLRIMHEQFNLTPPGHVPTGDELLIHRQIVNSEMMYKCIYNSLTPEYLKTLAPKLDGFDRNGPALLYAIIQSTHAATTLANRDYWKELQNASFKAANWDIEKLHSHIPVSYTHLTLPTTSRV